MKKIITNFLNDIKKEIENTKKEKSIKKQIPNLLTLTRGISPIIIIPTLLSNNIKLAIIELIIFALTDLFDGKIARKYNCVSEFGIKLDCVCDKIFVIGLIIPSIAKHPILLINLLLEFAISYINLQSEAKNNKPKSTMNGKIKTALLFTSLILTYIPKLDFKIIFIAILTTLIAQISALNEYRKIDKEKDRKKEKTTK